MKESLIPENMVLVGYLKDECRGKAKARKGYKICNDLEIHGGTVKLREMVNVARQRGAMICSCDGGYFYAETIEELQECYEQLAGRAGKIMQAARGMVGIAVVGADDL